MVSGPSFQVKEGVLRAAGRFFQLPHPDIPNHVPAWYDYFGEIVLIDDFYLIVKMSTVKINRVIISRFYDQQ